MFGASRFTDTIFPRPLVIGSFAGSTRIARLVSVLCLEIVHGTRGAVAFCVQKIPRITTARIRALGIIRARVVRTSRAKIVANIALVKIPRTVCTVPLPMLVLPTGTRAHKAARAFSDHVIRTRFALHVAGEILVETDIARLALRGIVGLRLITAKAQTVIEQSRR